MIVTCSPYRVSFAGGGSDIEAYYSNSKSGGAVLTSTIQKYSFITIHKLFPKNSNILLKYHSNELVTNINKINHPVFKEVLLHYPKLSSLEISSIADIPFGTGLASSSSFISALIFALSELTNTKISKKKLAEMVCDIEINKLNEPIGKQDQYSCIFGGINFIKFSNKGKVSVEKINISISNLKILEDNLLLFYTGKQRKTSSILKSQNSNILKLSKEYINMEKLVELAYIMRENLISCNFDDFGTNLHISWELKKTFSSKISNNKINLLYDEALNNGAIGGKLTGAGGGGFLLLYCPKNKQKKLKKALCNLQELDFKFDFKGSQLLFKT